MTDSYKSCYLIQHEENGYVHVVFDNIQAARAWMNHYNLRTEPTDRKYVIIQRQLMKSLGDICSW